MCNLALYCISQVMRWVIVGHYQMGSYSSLIGQILREDKLPPTQCLLVTMPLDYNRRTGSGPLWGHLDTRIATGPGDNLLCWLLFSHAHLLTACQLCQYLQSKTTLKFNWHFNATIPPPLDKQGRNIFPVEKQCMNTIGLIVCEFFSLFQVL